MRQQKQQKNIRNNRNENNTQTTEVDNISDWVLNEKVEWNKPTDRMAKNRIVRTIIQESNQQAEEEAPADLESIGTTLSQNQRQKNDEKQASCLYHRRKKNKKYLD